MEHADAEFFLKGVCRDQGELNIFGGEGVETLFIYVINMYKHKHQTMYKINNCFSHFAVLFFRFALFHYSFIQIQRFNPHNPPPLHSGSAKGHIEE